jgi:hypothetical protein
MTMQNDQEQEDFRSMIRGKSSKMSPSEMEGITFMSKGATNQMDWRAGMVVDMIAN